MGEARNKNESWKINNRKKKWRGNKQGKDDRKTKQKGNKEGKIEDKRGRKESKGKNNGKQRDTRTRGIRANGSSIFQILYFVYL